MYHTTRFDRVYNPLYAHYNPLAGKSRAPSSRGAGWTNGSYDTKLLIY